MWVRVIHDCVLPRPETDHQKGSVWQCEAGGCGRRWELIEIRLTGVARFREVDEHLMPVVAELGGDRIGWAA